MRLSEATLAELRARNPVAAVAERLGATLRKSGRSQIGPCPLCGGGAKSSRFEVKDDEAWVCAVCQSGGDVIRLVMTKFDTDFRAAVEWLGGAAAIDPAEADRLAREQAAKAARREAEVARYREAERKRLWATWQAARPLAGSPAEIYLRRRGLRIDGLRLRCAVLPFYHGEQIDERGRRSPRSLHQGPVLVAPILAPSGVFTGLHLTWLAANGAGKAEIVDPDTGKLLNAKKMRGSVKGGRIELIRTEQPHTLVMGEGIETTLTAADARGRPAGEAYWSALDLGNLGGAATSTIAHPTLKHLNGHAVRLPGLLPDMDALAIPVPDSVVDLLLIGDGDSERVLTATSLMRATARYARPGRVIRHACAPDNADLNDLVRGEPT